MAKVSALLGQSPARRRFIPCCPTLAIRIGIATIALAAAGRTEYSIQDRAGQRGRDEPERGGKRDRDPQAAAAPVGESEINAAIDRGSQFLARTYRERLDRGNLGASERVGQSALSLYTLLKTGSDPHGDLVQELLHEISKTQVRHTYDAACVLLALSAHDPIANRPWIDEVAEQLVAWQSPEGDWAYPEGLNDLSNTQYAALGLWAASTAGWEAPAEVWTKLAAATLRYTDIEGGFGYSVGGGRGRAETGSMTTAGVGTLAICETRLRRAKALPEPLAIDIADARKRGLQWLADNFSVKTNPRSGAWHHYYLYGLERLGAFVGAPRIGEHDWYDEGATVLVRAQAEDGSWKSGADSTDTCFALLFLRRATAYGAPRTQTGGAAAVEGAPFAILAEGEGPVSLFVSAWNKKSVRDLEWMGERGLGPRVAAIEYFVDGELASAEIGSPERAAGGSRFRTTIVFRGDGTHRARAVARVIAPDGTLRELESAEIEVIVSRPLPGWLDERRPRAADDLVPSAKPSAKASSSAKGEDAPFGEAWGAELAVDGNPRTAWLADEKDEKRELSITFPKSAKARVIQVRPAVLAPLGPAFLSRPVAIEVSVNGKPRGTLAMSPDPLQPVRLVLEEPLAIKRIDLAITLVARGDLSPLAGIGEVELFAEDVR